MRHRLLLPLFRPAVALMNRLRFPQKLALVCLLFLVSLGVTAAGFLREVDETVDFARKERLGAAYIHAMRPLIADLVQLRANSARKSTGAEMPGLATRIQNDISGVIAEDRRDGKALDSQEMWAEWQRNWSRWKQDRTLLTPQEQIIRSEELFAQALALVSHVGDSSNLILDPDLDSYYLMEITVNRQLALLDDLVTLQNLDSPHAGTTSISVEEKRLLILGQATKEQEAIQHAFGIAGSANTSIVSELAPYQVEFNQTLQWVFQYVRDTARQQIARSTVASKVASGNVAAGSVGGRSGTDRKSSQSDALYSAAIQATFAQHTLTTRILDRLLEKRIERYTARRNFVLGVIGVSVSLALYCLTGFYLSIRRMVDSLTSATDRLMAGEQAECVVLENRDELAQVVTAFNQVCVALQVSASQLRENNANLEQMVQERTRQMEHQAFHDALTGLPNRLLFLERLQTALSRLGPTESSGLAVLFLDLDNFKIVNDSLGHEAGDQLLVAIASRLRNCVRPGDTVARLGGDEFTLLLENLRDVDTAIQVAERVVEMLRAPISLPNNEIFASGSIGVAYRSYDFNSNNFNSDASNLIPSFDTGDKNGNSSSKPDLSPDSLVRDADTAMYHAKGSGKAGYALFDSSMNDSVVERMQLETALRFALERNEFLIHYQPLIDLESGQMSGAEALLRWNHPTLGLLAPAKFLNIAEETGLIVPIGYWVLEEACLQTQRWHNQYPGHHPFTINVNLSGRQLERDDVVERVQAALTCTGLNPACLKLEITESVMIRDMESTIARLNRLKALGIKLAMDDFGTGYSSISSLHRLPLDTIKIDRSFVQRLADQKQAVEVVSAIITLSRALHMDVTGEGVETLDHVAYLQSLGCTVGQGYFFARPLGQEAMSERMAHGSDCWVKNRDDAERELIEQLLKAA